MKKLFITAISSLIFMVMIFPGLARADNTHDVNFNTVAKWVLGVVGLLDIITIIACSVKSVILKIEIKQLRALPESETKAQSLEKIKKKYYLYVKIIAFGILSVIVFLILWTFVV